MFRAWIIGVICSAFLEMLDDYRYSCDRAINVDGVLEVEGWFCFL